jgi:hypothetical protein
MGMRIQIVGEVAKYSPDVEFSYSYAEGILASVWNYHVTPTNGGAQLEIAVEFMEASGLMGLLKRLLRPILRRIINQNIDRFHVWVERKHAPNP